MSAAACDYCAYMSSVSLPGHLVEVKTLARETADVFGPELEGAGVDALTFGRDVVAAYLELVDHETIDSHWFQLAFVRRVLRERTLGADLFRSGIDRLNGLEVRP